MHIQTFPGIFVFSFYTRTFTLLIVPFFNSDALSIFSDMITESLPKDELVTELKQAQFDNFELRKNLLEKEKSLEETREKLTRLQKKIASLLDI